MDNMEESDYEAQLRWLCQENYYNAMMKLAKEACMNFPTSESMKLLMAIGYALAGRSHDSITQVSHMIGTEDSTLAALFIQSIASRMNDTRDRMNLAQIDSRIREERRKASALALARAASVLFLFKKLDKAKEYAERAYKINSSDREVLLTSAWVSLCTLKQQEKSLQNSRELFALCSKNLGKELGVVLGMAKLEEYSGFHTEAISLLNSLIVHYPKLSLPLIEKMRNQLATKDWEQVMETANRILAIEPNSIDSMKAKAIVTICRDGDSASGLKMVQTLFRNLMVAEPMNVEILLDNIQLFSRITNRDIGILSELSRITEKIVDDGGKINAGPMIELGNLYVLMGKLAEAEHWYRSAVRIDESSFAALTGLANCQVLDTRNPSSMDLARQQLDFLMELESNSLDPRLLLMSAKLLVDEPNKALAALAKAINTLLKIAGKDTPYGYEYLKNINPVLSLEIVQEYLIHSPCQFALSRIKEDVAFNVDNVDNDNDNDRELVCLLLEKVADACPGMGSALLMLAKVRMQAGQVDEALAALRKLLDSVDPANPAAHLLTAQILAHQGQVDLAAQSLEVGLSFNFRVRDDPMYHLITSIVEKENGDLEACIASLRLALSLVNSTETPVTTNATPISTSDKATLYLELVAAYAKLKNFNEASAVMEEAKALFRHSLEDARVLIANAELCLEMGDLDKAVKCLTAVVPGKSYYFEAHTKLARIHLEQRNDRHAFAKCFRFVLYTGCIMKVMRMILL